MNSSATPVYVVDDDSSVRESVGSPVSYTHLDVYKRQNQARQCLPNRLVIVDDEHDGCAHGESVHGWHHAMADAHEQGPELDSVPRVWVKP